MEFEKIKNEILNSDFWNETKEFIFNHKLGTFICLIILILVINTDIWTTFDGLITTGTLLAVLVNLYINSKNRQKQLENIPIYFKIKETNTKYKLKLDIPRKEITRGEIQGLLSNFLVDSTKRYNIDSMSDNLDYLQNIYKVQNGECNELVILVSQEELEGTKKDEQNKNYPAFDLMKMEEIK